MVKTYLAKTIFLKRNFSPASGHYFYPGPIQSIQNEVPLKDFSIWILIHVALEMEAIGCILKYAKAAKIDFKRLVVRNLKENACIEGLCLSCTCHLPKNKQLYWKHFEDAILTVQRQKWN